MTRVQCSRCWKIYEFNEFIKLEHRLIDPKHKGYGYNAICKCGAEFNKDMWMMNWYEDGYRVSTVHLIFASINNMLVVSDLSEMWFETMIFLKESPMPFQARYKTQQDAEDGHWLAVKQLKDIIMYPDKYPQDLITTFFKITGSGDAPMELMKDIRDHVAHNPTVKENL